MQPLPSCFGPHLMLDCRQCEYDKINDLTHVYRVLDTLPAAIGMTKIIPPTCSLTAAWFLKIRELPVL